MQAFRPPWWERDTGPLLISLQKIQLKKNFSCKIYICLLLFPRFPPRLPTKCRNGKRSPIGRFFNYTQTYSEASGPEKTKNYSSMHITPRILFPTYRNIANLSRAIEFTANLTLCFYTHNYDKLGNHVFSRDQMSMTT